MTNRLLSPDNALVLRTRGSLLRLGGAALLIGMSLVALWQAGVLFHSDDVNTGPGGDQVALDHADTSLETPNSGALAVGLSEGNLAPDFAFSAFDGRRLKLSDFRGRAVLLNFWASWCIPCRAELPAIDTQLRRYGEEKLAVIAVNKGESVGTATGYLRDLEINLTAFAYDPKEAVVDLYDVTGLPTTYFIDARGAVTRVIIGPLTPTLIESGVDEALGVPASQ